MPLPITLLPIALPRIRSRRSKVASTDRTQLIAGFRGSLARCSLGSQGDGRSRNGRSQENRRMPLLWTLETAAVLPFCPQDNLQTPRVEAQLFPIEPVR